LIHTVGINQIKFQQLKVSEVGCRNLAEKLHVGNRYNASRADLMLLPIRSTSA